MITVGGPDEGEANVGEFDEDVDGGADAQVDQGRDVQGEQAVTQQTHTLEE